MVKVTSNASDSQLFAVVAYDAQGAKQSTVSSGVPLSGALAVARGFNAHSRSGEVAVVHQLPAHESALVELELGDFCQSRDQENDDRHCLWDWCRLGAAVESIDEIALDNECHRLILSYLAGTVHLPEIGSEDDDAVALCALVPIEGQLFVWNQLRKLF